MLPYNITQQINININLNLDAHYDTRASNCIGFSSCKTMMLQGACPFAAKSILIIQNYKVLKIEKCGKYFKTWHEIKYKTCQTSNQKYKNFKRLVVHKYSHNYKSIKHKNPTTGNRSRFNTHHKLSPHKRGMHIFFSGNCYNY